jgi:hypothetical protein
MANLLVPEHWRLRAEEARRSENESTDPEERVLLQEIARLYEKLAARLGRQEESSAEAD